MTLDQIAARWNLLIAIATSICTCIGGFLILPPLGQDRASWSKFGIFVVAVLVGLWLVPLHLYSTRKAMKFWLIGAILCVTASTFLYDFYERILNNWTFSYPHYSSQLVVAGSTLSRKSADFREQEREQGRNASDYDLLWNMGGVISDVWPKTEERTRRINVILELYLVELLLLSCTVVTVVQTSYCALTKPGPAGSL